MATTNKPMGNNATATPTTADSPQRIGMDLIHPYGVYVDYRQVAEYATKEEADQHFQRLYQAHRVGGAA
jgi:hypothetical protein